MSTANGAAPLGVWDIIESQGPMADKSTTYPHLAKHPEPTHTVTSPSHRPLECDGQIQCPMSQTGICHNLFPFVCTAKQYFFGGSFSQHCFAEQSSASNLPRSYCWLNVNLQGMDRRRLIGDQVQLPSGVHGQWDSLINVLGWTTGPDLPGLTSH